MATTMMYVLYTFLMIGAIFLGVYLVGWLTLLVHEGGHFLGAVLADAKIESVELGGGPLVAKFNYRGISWEIRAFGFAGNVCISEGRFAYSVRELAMFVAGGPLASLVLAGTLTWMFLPSFWAERFSTYEERLARSEIRASKSELETIMGPTLSGLPLIAMVANWGTVLVTLIPRRLTFGNEVIASDGLPNDGLQLCWLWFPEWKRAGKKSASTADPENDEST